ncbi:MAG: type II toxin-antitoxin system mRNA interferase toxin, RelE/StbE family [Candidatus Paceibacterota bacterium]
MRIQRIKISPLFEKRYKKIPKKIKEKAKEKEKIFRDNPFHPPLGTHKLSGKDKEYWAFWINYSYRIKFIFLNNEEVLFLDIGTHDIYK